MTKKIIVVAGGTGNLGGRIVTELLAKGTDVRVLVRKSSELEKVKHLESIGAKIISVDMTSDIGK